MRPMTPPDEICDLVVAACELLEHGNRTDVADPQLALDAAVLLAELHAAHETAVDAEQADDVAAVAADLDHLLARLDRLPPRVTALTG